jgi:NADPH:quinone reductase-like Zn-dependent oxidoreductase
MFHPMCFELEANGMHRAASRAMKAVRFHEYGDPDVLRYEDVEVPVPAPDEVRIRVAGTSFNPVEAGIRGGFLREAFPVALPHVPGIDVAGTIDAVGANVTGRRIGDRVIGFLPMLADGAAAEYVVAPARILAEAPASIPLADAAALPEAGLTAWQSLFEHAKLRAGQRLLVNGAGGAVGGYAVQLAKRTGAHVIATASPRSIERVRRAGADDIIDHSTTNVAGAVTQPVDVVLNLAPVAPAELSALARLVLTSGLVLSTVPTAVPEDTGGVRALAIFVRSDADQLAGLVARVDAGELHVDIAERVPLSELSAVHARADAGLLPGKVVILPAVA